MGTIPDEAMGPRMRALRNERQQKFAWIMACGELSAAEAAREAGYSDIASGAKVRAHGLMHNPAVLAAIEEASRNVLLGLAPLAIRKAKAILLNDKHPAHARIIETVLDRTGHFARTEHKVTVEHTVDTRELQELAKRLAGDLGVDQMKLIGPNVIEGEVVERIEEEAADA